MDDSTSDIAQEYQEDLNVLYRLIHKEAPIGQINVQALVRDAVIKISGMEQEDKVRKRTVKEVMIQMDALRDNFKDLTEKTKDIIRKQEQLESRG